MRTDFERDELQRFDRIARLGRAVEIGSRVLVGTAAAACAVVLVGRVLGVWMPPSAWWALGLAPALVATAVTFVRPRDTRGDAAILDRRFGLHGLLMVSAENAENDLGGWRPTDLGDRLARVAPRARPSLAAKNASIRSGVAAVLVAAIAFLGPLSAGIGGAGRPASVAMQDAIERTAGEIELARDDGALDEERGEELTQRADAMRERLLSGDDVAWSEVDLLREELAHEQAARRNALRALAESAAELSGDEADAESGRQAAELAARAAEAGLLDAVPEQTLEELARALAEAMRESAGSQAPSPRPGVRAASRCRRSLDRSASTERRSARACRRSIWTRNS
jgi:broad specificity phosphatase PhoE